MLAHTSTHIGFGRKMSNVQAFVKVRKNLRGKSTENDRKIIFLLTFKKTFDTSKYKHLSYKLEKYSSSCKIPICMRNFIGNNMLGLMKSKQTKVPLGSVLGTFWFLNYMNVLLRSSEITEVATFADDTSLNTSGEKDDPLLSRDVNYRSIWFVSNK